MAELLDTLRKNSLSSEECETLIEKCQHNGWLMRGGYDWQDDPYLEEYPYEFARLGNLDDLREYFSYGNWAIRQGVTYKDLAFIQQVNGGDEWWTLKQVDDGWMSFESITFGSMVKDPERFNHMICSMVASSPQICRNLDYLAPQELTDKLIWLVDEYGYYDVRDSHPDPADFRTYVIRSIQETPGDVCDWLQMVEKEAGCAEASELAKQVTLAFKREDPQQESLSDKAARVKGVGAHQPGQSIIQRDGRDK